MTLPPAVLASWYRTHPFDVRPVTDDSPFFWHFVRFRDIFGGRAPPLGGNVDLGVGERVLLVLLAVLLGLGAVFLLVPLVGIRHVWAAIPYKGSAAVYFAALGLGFMFLGEISLIQRLTLFLGYPTYSLTVTLFALLVSTGVGSLLAGRSRSVHRPRLLRLMAVLAALLLVYVIDRSDRQPCGARRRSCDVR